MPAGRSRNGPGQEVVVLQQRDLPRPRAVNPGMEADPPRVWKRGSPAADHAG